MRRIIRHTAERLFMQVHNHPAITLLFAGAATALAMPPIGLWPVLFITFPLLFAALNHATPRQAFGRAWLFAFAFHAAGLYWIANAMLVDAEKFWWAVPFAVAGLPAYFALYYGLMMAGFAVLCRWYHLTTEGRVFIFTALWMLAEVARSRLLTGFEWNLPAMAWADALPMLQSVSIIGVYGLSALTILLVLSPVLFAAGEPRAAKASIAIMLFAALWGVLNLVTHPTRYVDNVQLRLVQPNIPQTLKWDPAARDANFARLLQQSDTHAALTPTHIIWPEAAVPFVLNTNEQARLEIGLRAPSNGAVITGTLWRDTLPTGDRVYTNSMTAINNVGAVTTRFDKFHLVPFGEYFPLRGWLADIGIQVDAIAASGRDFTAGTGPRTLTITNAPPVSPLICYEVIFSGNVTDPHNRPAWLLNLTNDAWFGASSGPYQHFALARVRAVEEGLPMVRVANTGISGVIDSRGRVLAQTRLDESVTLDHGLPVAAPPTVFNRSGHALFLIFIGFMLTFGLLGCKVQIGAKKYREPILNG
jgi:apolipoprotein N-acyltransferase